MTPASDTGRTAEGMRAQEALALRDELMAYAAQLIRMSTQAGLGGRDLAVRVKEPEHLAHLITRAASAIQARKWAAAEAEAAQLRSRLLQAEKGAEAMRDALDQAEACLSIVEPRSDKAEYLRTLDVVRAALAPKAAPLPEARSENTGGRDP